MARSDIPARKHPAESSAHQYEYDGSSVRWLAANSNELHKLYPGKWVLVDKARVIAASARPTELAKIAEKRGIKAPMIVRVALPRRSAARTVYAAQIVRDNNSVR